MPQPLTPTDLLKQELRVEELVTLRENSELLLDTLVNLLGKVVHHCHEKGIPIENEQSINLMLHETRKLLQNLQGVPS
jgi:hypothetical protein